MRRLCLAVAISLGIMATSSQASSPREAALLAYLHTHLMPGERSEEDHIATATRVQIAWADLNGDGRPEAVVYVSGGGHCGSGGCDLLILEQTSKSFRIRGDLSITRPPIGVSKHRTAGWRDLTVFVAGGGILPGYRAVVPFRGVEYASNPTGAPAHRMKDGTPEDILIVDDVYPFVGG